MGGMRGLRYVGFLVLVCGEVGGNIYRGYKGCEMMRRRDVVLCRRRWACVLMGGSGYVGEHLAGRDEC